MLLMDGDGDVPLMDGDGFMFMFMEAPPRPMLWWTATHQFHTSPWTGRRLCASGLAGLAGSREAKLPAVGGKGAAGPFRAGRRRVGDAPGGYRIHRVHRIPAV